MNNVDSKIERLLRSAALVKDEAPIEAPFGFDTRVVAIWRGLENAESIGLTRLVRRVALVAAAVTVIATAGAYYESQQSTESSEPFANEFAIADSAIQSEFPQ
jgi:hypothetical protein